ncbi:hypothetical protein DL767_007209 [Monosporascus sp. MG133]|nr:hypothetical protein DL767_007209 [Monosporascus sp. MG133]
MEDRTSGAYPDCEAAQAAYGATTTVLTTVVTDAPWDEELHTDCRSRHGDHDSGLHEHADLISAVTQTPQMATSIAVKRLNGTPTAGASASAPASAAACTVPEYLSSASAAPSDYLSACVCLNVQGTTSTLSESATSTIFTMTVTASSRAMDTPCRYRARRVR